MKFSQDMYEEEIIAVIRDHGQRVGVEAEVEVEVEAGAATPPLFIYMPFQVTHSPTQPPPKLVESYNANWFLGIRKVYAFVTAMDESVGQ